jgi:MSHA type pilus biogenesis protein MshL
MMSLRLAGMAALVLGLLAALGITPPALAAPGTTQPDTAEESGPPALEGMPGGEALPAGTEPAHSAAGNDEARISVAAMAADMRSVLLTIADQVELDMVIDPDVSGTVTLEIEEMPLREALDAVIAPTGYEYAITDGLLRVYGNEIQTRMFNLNYMTASRSGLSQLSASSGGSGGSTSTSGETSGGDGSTTAQSSSSVNSETSSDPWKEIVRGLELIVFGEERSNAGGGFSGPERLVAHPASGVVLVTASYATLNRVAHFLERIEGCSHRQVTIEARIVEVGLRTGLQTGIDWSRIPGPGDISSVFDNDEIGVVQRLSPQNGVFQIAGSSGDFEGVLDALAEQGNLKVISAPRVATLNNQKAVIKAAREESFFSIRVEYEYQPDGSRMPIYSVEPERITIGLILDVTPQISADGAIMMHIHPSLTELVGEEVFPPDAQGDEVQANAPILDIREVDTVVRVGNGNMLIIGGLTKEQVRDEVRQVPLLGSIPILGHLFRHTNRVTHQVELLILLKPTVVIGEEADRVALSALESLGQ